MIFGYSQAFNIVYYIYENKELTESIYKKWLLLCVAVLIIVNRVIRIVGSFGIMSIIVISDGMDFSDGHPYVYRF